MQFDVLVLILLGLGLVILSWRGKELPIPGFSNPIPLDHIGTRLIVFFGAIFCFVLSYIAISPPSPSTAGLNPINTAVSSTNVIPTQLPTPELVITSTSMASTVSSVPSTVISTAAPIDQATQTTALITATSPTQVTALVNEINKKQDSDEPGVSMTVVSVELLPDNRMRWNLLFENTSTSDSDINIWNRRTLLTDEFGNQYAVIRDAVDVSPTGSFNQDLRAGQKIKHWLEFEAPKEGATEFVFALESGNNGPRYETFSISIK